MLTLLSPAALWALAALALPMALHLWRQPPRTVRLGSLRFLRTQPGARWRDLRWRERLLLGIRLALLVLLALLLARPVWQQAPSHEPQRWALLDPAAKLDGPILARWQALRAAGYEGHWLAANFPAAASSSAPSDEAATDVWSLLQEADATLPAGSTLAVFSPARITGLRGVRPNLHSQVEWVATKDGIKSPAVFLQRAVEAGSAANGEVEGPSTPLYSAQDDREREDGFDSNGMRSKNAGSKIATGSKLPGGESVISVGISDAHRLSFTNQLPLGWKLKTSSQQVRLLGPNNQFGAWVPFSTTRKISVLILHDAGRAEDTRYLAAALRAVAKANDDELDLREAVITPNLPPQPPTDWTFWLSDAEPPPAIANRSTVLWQDAADAGSAVNDRIVPQPGTPGAEFLTSPVALWRRSGPPAGAVYWTDAQGAPLLTRTETAHGSRWHFASRFHPVWSDLPCTTVLPALLGGWLQPTLPARQPLDLRQAAAGQARPGILPSATSRITLSPARAGRTDLHWPLFILAACLFGLERGLSHWSGQSRVPAVRREPEEVLVP